MIYNLNANYIAIQSILVAMVVQLPFLLILHVPSSLHTPPALALML